MHHGQHAELLASIHAARKLLIIDHEGAFVSHKELEGVDAVLDRVLHFLFNHAAPLRDSHVKPVVHARLLSLSPVDLVALGDAAVERQRKVDVHGGAAGKRRSLPAEKVITRFLAHEGHFKVGVGLNATRHDVPER